jgi:hypothetical protein
MKHRYVICASAKPASLPMLPLLLHNLRVLQALQFADLKVAGSSPAGVSRVHIGLPPAFPGLGLCIRGSPPDPTRRGASRRVFFYWTRHR